MFDDPLFVLQDVSRNEEQRDAVIGGEFISLYLQCKYRSANAQAPAFADLVVREPKRLG